MKHTVQLTLVLLLSAFSAFAYRANSLWVLPLSSDRLHNIGMSEALDIHNHLIDQLRASGNWDLVVEPEGAGDRFSGYDSLGFPYQEADRKQADLCLLTSIRHTGGNYYGIYRVYNVFDRTRIISGIIQASTIDELKKKTTEKIRFQFPPLLPVESVDTGRGIIRLKIQPGMDIDPQGALTLFAPSQTEPDIRRKATAIYKKTREGDLFYLPAGNPKILSVENGRVEADRQQAGSFDPSDACAIYRAPRYRQGKKPFTVAVMDLDCQVEGLNTVVASDLLRNILFERLGSNLLERSAMNEILREQGFQQSGACDQQACVVEAGQLLGADRMIFGSVGRLGEALLLSVRLVNVATGQIENNVIITEKTSIENLQTLFKRAVTRIFLQYDTEEEKIGLGDLLDDHYILYGRDVVDMDDEKASLNTAIPAMKGKIALVGRCREPMEYYMAGVGNEKADTTLIARGDQVLAFYNLYALSELLKERSLKGADSTALARYLGRSIHYYGNDDFRRGVQQEQLTLKQVEQILSEIPDVHKELVQASSGRPAGISTRKCGGGIAAVGAIVAYIGLQSMESGSDAAGAIIISGGVVLLVGSGIGLLGSNLQSESTFNFQKALYIYNRRLLGYLD